METGDLEVCRWPEVRTSRGGGQVLKKHVKTRKKEPLNSEMCGRMW